LSVKHPSYITDTCHLIKIVKDLSIPINSFFITIDINTQLDIEAGLRAEKHIFLKYPDKKKAKRRN